MMDIQDFFNSTVMRLPRDRSDDDFERYLENTFAAYLAEIGNLDPNCHLGARIQEARSDVVQLCSWIRRAVHHYLSGLPPAAYNELVKGITFVAQRLVNLKSLDVSSDAIGPLYRIADTKGAKAHRERLFHAPFHLRHHVGQHRYGIPGFPCLYLGGSLALCLEECRIQAAALAGVSIAEFTLRGEIRILDFGYKPQALAKIAAGSAMRPRGANAQLEQFIIDYATCWPLIAASSIKVRHDGKPFVYEYIVPQMILQWLMGQDDCDGIRYFSTRFLPEEAVVRPTANYVFPAVHGSGPQTGYSARLKALFELTDPMLWGPGKIPDLMREATERESALKSLAKAPLS
jgi:hypothetical protein